MVSFFPPSTAAPMLSHSKTILVTGTYHPSAPIHLALSHLEEAQNPYVIAISSSRSIFKESLTQYDDHWLAINSGHGRISSLLAEISISYPPSPAHFCLFLSLLQTCDRPQPLPAGTSEKTVMPIQPSLIILHELSSYFLPASSDLNPWTVSSYLSLLLRSFECINALIKSSSTKGPISLVLFDSQLQKLELPIVTPPRPLFTQLEPPSRLVNVVDFVTKYFEEMISFSDDDADTVPSSQGEDEDMSQDKRSKQKMEIIHTSQPDVIQTVRWIEIREAHYNASAKFVWS